MAELNIVLVEPEIPQNTGNIARTCAVTGARLHIVKPMGFTPTDKHLKRAGLDYWNYLDLTYYENLDDFFFPKRQIILIRILNIPINAILFSARKRKVCLKNCCMTMRNSQ